MPTARDVATGKVPMYRGARIGPPSGPSYFVSNETFARTYGPTTEYRLHLKSPREVSSAEWANYASSPFNPIEDIVEGIRASGHDGVIAKVGPLWVVLALSGWSGSAAPGLGAPGLVTPDGDDYFSPLAWSQARREAGDGSRTIILHMRPQHFLQLALPLPRPDKEKHQNVQRVVAEGIQLQDLPRLFFQHDGKGTAWVTGHEGRHRSMILAAEGVTQMPVRFRSLGGGGGAEIRWMNQDDRFDRIQGVWPRVLFAEGVKSGIQYGIPFSFPVPDLREVRE